MTTAIVSNAKTIQTRIFSNRDQIQKLLPAGLDVDRFMQIAWGLVRRNPNLLDCTPESIIAGIGQGASLGLSFDPVLGQAFLVPYRNKKKGGVREAQFQAGYRGLANLAYRSNRIVKIYAEVVHKLDKFEAIDGTEQKIIHVKNFGVDREIEEEWIGAYAVAVTKEGATFSKYLTAAEIIKRRSVSKSAEYEDSIWKVHPKEMWLKCPVRALAKLLPMSTETEEAIRAAIADEYRDAGVEMPEAIDGRIEVETAALPARNGQKASPEQPESQERPIYKAAWRNPDVLELPFVPEAVLEQKKFRDLCTKSGKLWITIPACQADVQALFEECGFELFVPAAPQSAEPKAGAEPSPEKVNAPTESLSGELGF